MTDQSQKHTETVQTFFLIFSVLLMTVLFLSKYLHESPRLNAVLSEPAMTLLVGMAFSFIVSLFFVLKEGEEDFNGNAEQEVEKDLADSILSFQTKVFFMALLPPILFNSGYQLQRELFYRHFAPIALFACVGTCISGVCTGSLLVMLRHFSLLGSFDPTVMELLTFGALIAATDTVSVVGILQAKQVDPHLFSLVFGESALNDAVSIVLFRSLSSFLIQDAFGAENSFISAFFKFLGHLTIQAACSPLLGMLFAFAMGFAFKLVDLREHKMLELSLYIMPMYIPFILSEALELSGMITIFFTGIFARRYMAPNVSSSTRKHSEMLFKLFAFMAETCIVLELGLCVFGLVGKFEWRFIGWALLAALIGRAASIYPLAAIYNLSLTRAVKDCSPCSEDTSTDSPASSNNESSAPLSPSSWSMRRETPSSRMDKRISLKFMHMLTFAGLRGAVAYACARDFPNLYGNTDNFVAATIAIAVFTIVIMGGGTKPLMEYLKIRTNVDYKEYMRQWHSKRKLKGRFHRLEYHYIFRKVVRPSREDPYIRRTMTPIVDRPYQSMDFSMAHMMDETIGSHLPNPMGISSAGFRVRHSYPPPLPVAPEEPILSNIQSVGDVEPMDDTIGSHLPNPMGISSAGSRVRNSYVPPLPTAPEEPVLSNIQSVGDVELQSTSQPASPSNAIPMVPEEANDKATVLPPFV